jgi:hypothetical protein
MHSSIAWTIANTRPAFRLPGLAPALPLPRTESARATSVVVILFIPFHFWLMRLQETFLEALRE